MELIPEYLHDADDVNDCADDADDCDKEVHDRKDDDLINDSNCRSSKKKDVLLSDLLMCKIPTEEDNVMSYVMEVVSRIKICMDGEQFDDLMTVIDRCIVCMMLMFRTDT